VPEYPIQTRLALQAAVKALLKRDNPRLRMTRATDPLVGLRLEDFPERIRGRATRVLAARGAHAKHYADSTVYFEELSQKELKTLVEDILALYEVCLIDIGEKLTHHWLRCRNPPRQRPSGASFISCRCRLRMPLLPRR
jgi:hypothetical protein